ncbi:hypothetical protein SAMN03159341_11780 [Paenibacillus sp. 1_12]|uniref:hypothetical protein n=1 Tax=Paenibacillus sp. 1_12 TaxID=1566278 RepID=UPI0008EAB48D|nr:hypothetical protein [Paenibacillus sp. 1_12]SFM12995.1 hypothetical protein SAMN03159341_11780 [Paenibacillus sp. 1_12]
MLNKFLGTMKNERIVLKCFLVISILFTLMYIFSYKTIIDSDGATANLLAREQIYEGKYFPQYWFYAQDIWVLSINNLVLIMNSITSDNLLSRAISVLLQNIFLIIVVYKIFNKFRTKNGVLIALILICSGISDLFLDMFYGQAAYSNVVLCILLAVLLVFNVIESKLSFKKQLVYSCVMIVFSILMNMMGLRYIFYCFIPLTISLLIYLLYEYVSLPKFKKNIRGYIFSLTFIFLAIVIGFFINSIIMKHTGFVKGVTNLTYTDSQNLFNSVKLYILGFLELFSALPRAGTSFLTLEGIFSFYRIISLFIIVFCIPVFMLSNYKSLSNKYLKITILFYVISFVMTSYVFIFGSFGSGDASSRYFLIIFFVSLIIFGAYYDSFIQNKPIIIRSIFIICIVPLLISSYIINIKSFYSLDRATNQIVKKDHRLEAVKNFLQNKNLHFGYATYWNAGALTLLSNYKLEVPAIDFESLTPFKWLTSQRWYQNDYHTGETFLLLLDNERNNVNRDKLNSYLGEPIKVYKENNFDVLVYNFNISLKLPGWPMVRGTKQIIKARDLPSLTGTLQENTRIATEGFDKPGVLTFGPYTNLSQGKYILKLNYTANYMSDDKSLSKWDLGFTAPGKWEVIDQGVIDSTTDSLGQISREIEVKSDNATFEFRTFYEGKGNITIISIEVEKIE